MDTFNQWSEPEFVSVMFYILLAFLVIGIIGAIAEWIEEKAMKQQTDSYLHAVIKSLQEAVPTVWSKDNEHTQQEK